ncbi:hypothetical protein KFE25_004418 [Diacronema lutheri]|uniref:Uncharacterized protein n=1 Tax=Diacronema lutheri TaxID=2081491 RepID=A0A8J6BZC7_DIALT|nr:hypothetical protein KFE25_004418 [Diacronema lutheri]
MHAPGARAGFRLSDGSAPQRLRAHEQLDVRDITGDRRDRHARPARSDGAASYAPTPTHARERSEGDAGYGHGYPAGPHPPFASHGDGRGGYGASLVQAARAQRPGLRAGGAGDSGAHGGGGWQGGGGDDESGEGARRAAPFAGGSGSGCGDPYGGDGGYDGGYGGYAPQPVGGYDPNPRRGAGGYGGYGGGGYAAELADGHGGSGGSGGSGGYGWPAARAGGGGGGGGGGSSVHTGGATDLRELGRGRGDEGASYTEGYTGQQGEGGLWTLPNQRAAQPRPHPPPPKGLSGDDVYSRRHAFLKHAPERPVFRTAQPNAHPHAPAHRARGTDPIAPVYGTYHGDVVGGVTVRSPPGAMALAAMAADERGGGGGHGGGGYVPSTMRNDDVDGSAVGSAREVQRHRAMGTRACNRHDDIAGAHAGSRRDAGGPAVYRQADVVDEGTGELVRVHGRLPGQIAEKATNRVADISGATPMANFGPGPRELRHAAARASAAPPVAHPIDTQLALEAEVARPHVDAHGRAPEGTGVSSVLRDPTPHELRARALADAATRAERRSRSPPPLPAMRSMMGEPFGQPVGAAAPVRWPSPRAPPPPPVGSVGGAGSRGGTAGIAGSPRAHGEYGCGHASWHRGVGGGPQRSFGSPTPWADHYGVGASSTGGAHAHGGACGGPAGGGGVSSPPSLQARFGSGAYEARSPLASPRAGGGGVGASGSPLADGGIVAGAPTALTAQWDRGRHVGYAAAGRSNLRYEGGSLGVPSAPPEPPAAAHPCAASHLRFQGGSLGVPGATVRCHTQVTQPAGGRSTITLG